jgi:uncharacterized protein (DUF488 family)
MNNRVIFTVGHSTHKVEYFLELLRRWEVTCIVDVRSVPASRFNPQFSKASLVRSLNSNNISYVHMGEEFGARITDPTLLGDGGQVDFYKVQKSVSFQKGVERLKDAVDKRFVIALMCAESDPLTCHRFAMITPILKNEGFDVRHILKDKSTLSTQALEELMVTKFTKRSYSNKLFSDDDNHSAVDEAYQLLSKKIAFFPNTSADK